MKKLFFLFLLALNLNAFAQVPQGIPYQAAARGANGQPLVNTSIMVRFSIIDSVATGTTVYQETHAATTNTVGLFSVNVGLGTPVTGTFAGINWGKNFKFMKVELDPSGTGSNYTDLGTQQMMSVPYALYAGNVNSSNVGIANVRIGYGNSGTWVCPLGVTTIIVELWGAGGGGEQMSSRAGANGGNGGYVKQIYTVVPGNSYNVVVGIGGGTSYYGTSPYTIINGPGGTGGSSSFDNTIFAQGGLGGASGINGADGTVVNWQYGVSGSAGTTGAVSYIPNTWTQNPPTGVALGGTGTSYCGYSFLACSATHGESGYCIITY